MNQEYAMLITQIERLEERLQLSLTQIEKGMTAEIDLDQRNFQKLYDEVGSIMYDLGVFFFRFPQLSRVIDVAKSQASDRKIRELYDSLGKQLRDKYYSFMNLKDLVVGLERFLRVKMHYQDKYIQ